MICMTDSTEFTLTQLINSETSKRGQKFYSNQYLCYHLKNIKPPNAVKLSNICLLKWEPKIYYAAQDNVANANSSTFMVAKCILQKQLYLACTQFSVHLLREFMDDICIGGNDMLLKGAKCNIFIMRISGVVPVLSIYTKLLVHK